jgi:hypothetical protein
MQPLSSRLKTLAGKNINASISCAITLLQSRAEQIEHNIKASKAESKVKGLLGLSKY